MSRKRWQDKSRDVGQTYSTDVLKSSRETNQEITKIRLALALRWLRQRGYWTSAIPEEHSGRWVLYHHTEHFNETGKLYLTWSGDGREIVNHLKAAQLNVEWDGDPRSRILVW